MDDEENRIKEESSAQNAQAPMIQDQEEHGKPLQDYEEEAGLLQGARGKDQSQHDRYPDADAAEIQDNGVEDTGQARRGECGGW